VDLEILLLLPLHALRRRVDAAVECFAQPLRNGDRTWRVLSLLRQRRPETLRCNAGRFRVTRTSASRISRSPLAGLGSWESSMQH
jgi:hypothetical protein